MLTPRGPRGNSDGVPATRQEESHIPDMWSLDPMRAADEHYVRNLASAVFRRKGLIAMVFVALSATSLAILAALPVRFSSEVLVSIDQRHARVVNVESVLSNLTPDVETFQTQIHVILSRPMLKRVAETLHLPESAEYAPTPQNGLLDVINRTADRALGHLGIEGSHEKITPSTMTSNDAIEHSIDLLQKRLQVWQVGKSHLLRMAIESADPQFASDIVNALAEIYISSQLQVKIDATKRANTWIGERVAELQDQVAKSEAAVETFRAESGLTRIQDSATGRDGTLLSEQLAAATREYVNAQKEKALIAGRLEEIGKVLKSGGSLSGTADVLQSRLIQELRQREIVLGAQIEELTGKFGDRYPKLVDARAQMQELRNQISNEINKVASSLRNDYRVQLATEQSVKGRIEQLSHNATRQSSSVIHLRALERVADTNRNLLQTFLTRWKETSSDENLPQPDAAIVAPSVPSRTPSFPRYRLFGVVSVMLSLVCAVFAALVAETFNRNLFSMQQVEQFMGVRALGLIPRLKKRRMMTRLGRQREIRSARHYAEAIKSLCVRLRLTSKSAPPQAILVTSSLPGEGKSTLIHGMATHLSNHAKRVVIVDGDLRRPSVHRLLGAPSGPGLREWLVEGGIAAVHSTNGGISVVPAGSAGKLDKGHGIFDSEALASLIFDLKREFDMVLIDSPPVLAVADTLTLSEVADQIIIVVRWGATPLSIAQRGMRQIYESSNKIAGVVLTFVHEKRHAKLGFGDSGFFRKEIQRYYSA